DLGGYPVTVIDTAGIRETEDPVEREGVRRAGEQSSGANLVLWGLDATAGSIVVLWVLDPPAGEPQTVFWVRHSIQVPPGTAFWFVVNKMDLVREEEKRRIESRFDRGTTVNYLSSTTGQGVDELVAALSRFSEEFFTPEPALVTRERHRAHLQETLSALAGA